MKEEKYEWWNSRKKLIIFKRLCWCYIHCKSRRSWYKIDLLSKTCNWKWRNLGRCHIYCTINFGRYWYTYNFAKCWNKQQSFHWQWQRDNCKLLCIQATNLTWCYKICYRNSNFLTISSDMWYTSIIIIIWLNISKKRIPNSAGL